MRRAELVGGSLSQETPGPVGAVDAVYTWVNGGDPAWAARREAALRARVDGSVHPTAYSESRYEDHQELRYSLRSLRQYAPWIRRTYLVTDQQVPEWLVESHPGLVVIDHRELLGSDHLPTFNSHAIETALFLIPGLSEHFLYFNDDVLLGTPVSVHDFFTSDGKSRVFRSPKAIEGDLPVMQAARRNSRILQELTGEAVTRRYRHTPHPQQVSVSAELAAAIPDEIDLTRSHRFRDPGDISFASSLVLSYAVATGRAVPSDIDYVYVDLSTKRSVLDLLKLLLNPHRTTICLNQVGSVNRATAKLLKMVCSRLWPSPTAFENDQSASYRRDKTK